MFYKKYTDIILRTKFSKKIRQKGNGYIPIVIDSYDIDTSKSLNMCLKKNDVHIHNMHPDDPDSVRAWTSQDHYTYGVEIPFYIDSTIGDLKNYIYENEYIHDYIQNIKNYDLVLYTDSELESQHHPVFYKDPDYVRACTQQDPDYVRACPDLCSGLSRPLFGSVPTSVRVCTRQKDRKTERQKERILKLNRMFKCLLKI